MLAGPVSRLVSVQMISSLGHGVKHLAWSSAPTHTKLVWDFKEPKLPGGQVVLGIVVLAILIIHWLGGVYNESLWAFELDVSNVPYNDAVNFPFTYLHP